MNTPTINDLRKLTDSELQKLSDDAFSEYYRLATRPCGDWTPGRTFPDLDAATARLEAIDSEIERRLHQ